MPPICIGFFDRDLAPRTVDRFRWTYMSGRENLDLNFATMSLWLLQVCARRVVGGGGVATTQSHGLTRLRPP